MAIMTELHSESAGIDGEWLDTAFAVVDQQSAEVCSLFLGQYTGLGSENWSCHHQQDQCQACYYQLFHLNGSQEFHHGVAIGFG